MKTLLAWSLFLSVALHNVEEFGWPGGFPRWYRAYRPRFATSMTTRFFIIVNGIALLMCALAALFIANPFGVGLWLMFAALVAANTLFHVRGCLATKSYSPGTVTALALYVPLAVYGYAHYIATRQASVGTAVIALIMGASYQFWSNANHARRSRAEV